MAQQKTHSLSVELLGAQTIVGINYDSRFNGNSGLGYRVGIGYGYGDTSGLIDQKINGVGVPLELNYLLGKKISSLETSATAISAPTASCFVLAYRRRSTLATSTDSARLLSFRT